jgi:hypothetical protein
MATGGKAVPKAKKPEEQYIFRPFNAETFAATSEAWNADVAVGKGFAPEVEQTMTWVSGHLTLTDNEMAYGIFAEKQKVAFGVCELAITKPSIRGKWVKLIKLRLRPHVDELLFQNNPDGTSIALNSYVAAVLGVYHVKNAHEATTIKIYGRTQDQMRFLTLMLEALKQRKDATFMAEIQGRWLTLNWGKK